MDRRIRGRLERVSPICNVKPGGEAQVGGLPGLVLSSVNDRATADRWRATHESLSGSWICYLILARCRVVESIHTRSIGGKLSWPMETAVN